MSSGREPHEPHLAMTLPNTAVLFVKGLRSDRRERRRLERPPSPRPWWGAIDPRVHDPVFVVGAPRSGTTFLGGCLGQVPGVSYHFEPRLTKALVRYVYTGEWSERRAARVFKLSYASLLLAAGDGSRRFVDKTPENAFLVPFLARTFPTARFVHIVRDGRDVTVSHAEQPWLRAASAGSGRRGRGGAEWGPHPRFWVEPEGRERFSTVSDLERSAWCWRRFTSVARGALATLPPEQGLETRYEALLADPAGEGDRLARFLGLDASATAALHAALAQGRSSSVGRWRQRLTAEEESLVVAQCGPLLRELGYQ